MVGKISKMLEIIEIIRMTRSLRYFDNREYQKTIDYLDKFKFSGKYVSVVDLIKAVCHHHVSDFEIARKFYDLVLERSENGAILDEATSTYIKFYIMEILDGGDFAYHNLPTNGVDSYVLRLFPFRQIAKNTASR